MSAIALFPGEGIGNSIRLGESLYTIINRFLRHNHKLKVIYSDKQYLEAPILVELPELGFRLLFESSCKQELLLIEVNSFAFVKLCYNEFKLNDLIYPDKDFMEERLPQANDNERTRTSVCTAKNGQPKVKLATLHQIYNKIFGPTYPGRLVPKMASYILLYPGMLFRFHIKLSLLLQKLSTKGAEETLSELLNWDAVDDIACESLCIFNGDSWDDFYKTFSANLSSREQPKKFVSLKLRPKIESLSVDLSLGRIDIKTGGTTFTMELGRTTQQEVLSILGPPEDYFNKFDSRLMIHKNLRHPLADTMSQGNNSILKFHNYFLLGLDFLYNLNPSHKLQGHTTGVLQKVIIHNGGIAESLDFMKWNKCNWQIRTGVVDVDGTDHMVDSSMYFKDIPAEFFSSLNQREICPVLLNRNEAEFIDTDLDIINAEDVSGAYSQVAAAASLEQTIETSNKPHNVSRSKVVTWGQSVLYGGNRCIWEVVQSNGCISCVTIY